MAPHLLAKFIRKMVCENSQAKVTKAVTSVWDVWNARHGDAPEKDIHKP